MWLTSSGTWSTRNTWISDRVPFSPPFTAWNLWGRPMPYVKRDAAGRVVAVSLESAPGFIEELEQDSAEITALLGGGHDRETPIGHTDQDFVRVLEDVVQLLIDKGVILFTDLPPSAQAKIMRRQRLRSELAGKLDLIGDD